MTRSRVGLFAAALTLASTSCGSCNHDSKDGATASTGVSSAAVSAGLGEPPPPPLPAGRFLVQCDGPSRKISPYIYGINFDLSGFKESDGRVWNALPTARRWGGDLASTYNWELGAYNHGGNWFFQNTDAATTPGKNPHFRYLDDNVTKGVFSELTIPMMGYVAKDTTSSSWPKSLFPAQAHLNPEMPAGGGDGETPSGNPIPSLPTRAGVAITPDFVKRWVQAIRAHDAKTGKRSVDVYILDNEPGIWNFTHRDFHPEPQTYDELLDKTLKYAAAIKEADPDAKIAGPAAWNAVEASYSAKDSAAGAAGHADRAAHGDVPQLAFYLRALRDYEKKHGKKLLDYVDFHMYSTIEGIAGAGEKSDAQAKLARIEAPRMMWDPTYVEKPKQLDPFPLARELRHFIDENYPGLGLQFGEWSFGGEKDVSGAIAVAETLGRFGVEGVDAAFLLSPPENGSPVQTAFRLFRNYDGKGARFLDTSVPAKGPADAGIYASKDATGTKLVLVLTNRAPSSAIRAAVDVSSCGAVTAERNFVYRGDFTGVVPAPTSGTGVSLDLPGWSIAVVELTLGPKK